jgi:hypothetical protein
MTELNSTQKLIIIETIKDWPKLLDSNKLLKILDEMAKKIIEAK